VQRAGVLGWLENAVCFDSAKAVHAVRHSRIVNDNGRTMIVHTAEETPKEQVQAPRSKIVLADFEGDSYSAWTTTGEAFGKGPAHGTLPSQQRVSGFLGKGLVNTFLKGDRPQGTLTSPAFEISRKYLHFLIGGGSQANQTCINLLIDGKAVRTATGKDNEKLEWHFWNVEDLQGKTARLEIVDRQSGGWGHINVDQIELADEASEGNLGPLTSCATMGPRARVGRRGPRRQEHTRDLEPTSDGPSSFTPRSGCDLPGHGKTQRALATKMVKLAPKSTRTFTFLLAWFFPNHPQGHEYDSRFADAAKVARYVLDNHDRLTGDTKKWHQTFYEDSTLPRWLLFRLHSTASTLATGTCQWRRSGRFWAWEGVGCCEGTCTHVWNYAHTPARLFPELERSARDAGFRRRFRSRQRPRWLPQQPHLCGGRPVRHDPQSLSRVPVLGGRFVPATELAPDQESPGILDQAGRQRLAAGV
jgi:hypothetical protein